MTTNGVTARHSSATVEHYTPADIVEAARFTLGGIDLDPFSCAEANEMVDAAAYFGGYGGTAYAAQDGFDASWWGRVFVNPPGGKTANESNQARAWRKFVAENAARRVRAGIFVCFSLEFLQVSQTAGGTLPLDFPICYPKRRIRYRKPGGEIGASPPHASCIVLIPAEMDMGGADMIARFRQAFAPLGKVVVPR